MSWINDVGTYLGGARILLIDDSEPFQRLTRAMLEKLGVESVTMASTLEEGVHYVHSSKTDMEQEATQFDLVLMDLNLPDGNGIEGCHFITGYTATREIPLVVVTETSDPEVIRSAYSAGASDFMQKPLSAEILRARLGTLLKLKAFDSLEETD